MTAADDLARARELMGGALPMPLGSDRCYRPAPKPADTDRPLTQLQSDLRKLVAQQRAAALAERLRWLMAHPDEAPHTPATAGELAEQRHLLYDADPDATVPAFPYPTSLEAS